MKQVLFVWCFTHERVSCSMYSETCANGHLYSETTCIKRALRDVPKVSVQYILTPIQRPPLYKGHYEVALAWPFNTGFTVFLCSYRPHKHQH